MIQKIIHNKWIFIIGILTGLLVLSLLVLFPNDPVIAKSVRDEVYRRMTETVPSEQLQLAAANLDVFTGDAAEEYSFEVQSLPVEEEAPGEGLLPADLESTGVVVAATPTFQELDTAGESSLEAIIPTEIEENLPVDSGNDIAVDQSAPTIFRKPPIFRETPLAIETVNPTRLVKPTLEPSPTRVPTEIPPQVPTAEPTAEPTAVPTAVPTNTPVPTQEPDPKPTDAPDVFWQAGFETGDISEWTAHGDWLRQGDTATYAVQRQVVHSGEYAVKFTIDTSSGASQAAYLFYWDPLPEAAYYSAWYYIPANIDTEQWWNLMQWKSTYNGNTDYSRPIFVLDGALFGQTALSLCYLPDREEDKQCWKQTQMPLPQDQWVHIEVYYERDKQDGHVIVWQDGVKLFDISGYPTVLSDGTLYYSVNHYTDGISPDVSSIYIDDVVISLGRIGQDITE